MNPDASSSIPSLSLTQITSLAPNIKTLERAQKLADPQRFIEPGYHEHVIWATVLGHSSYTVWIDLHDRPAYACSCPVRQMPCKHALALLILLSSIPQLFAAATMPTECQHWIQRRRARASHQIKKSSIKDVAAQQKRIQEREQKIAQGLAELQQFLEDAVRIGLATLAHRDDLWDKIQRRLIDAQAQGIANRLNWIRNQIGHSNDWATHVIPAFTQLHLLIAAYHHQQHLPPAMADDIRELVGWHKQRETILARKPVAGSWLVLSTDTRYESGFYQQHIWLYNCHHQQFAVIRNFAHEHNQAILEFNYQPGTLISAQAYFYSDYQPLRAIVHCTNTEQARPLSDWTTLEADLVNDFTSAIRQFHLQRTHWPFLIEYPFLIRDARLVMKQNQLAISDAHHQLLPVAHNLAWQWHLLLHTGPDPVWMFITYDGHYATPRAIRNWQQHWISLAEQPMTP
jgi:hypothetical protein